MAALVAFFIARCAGNKSLKFEKVLEMAGHPLAPEPQPSKEELRQKTKAFFGMVQKRQEKKRRLE